MTDQARMTDRVSVVALVLPARTDVRAYARAWFPDADWVRSPQAAETAPVLVGARFRGAPAADARPGVLALGRVGLVVGPLPCGRDDHDLWWVTGAEQELGPGPVLVAVPGAEPAPAPGPTADAGPAWAAWADAVAGHASGTTGRPGSAAAGLLLDVLRESSHGTAPSGDARVREVGGRVLDEVRHRLVRPASPRAGTRTLFSPTLLDVQRAFDLLVRHGLRTSLEHLGERHRGVVGDLGYTLVGRTAFDGAVVLRMSRADVEPPALRDLPWRDHGPFAYELAWRPEHASGETVDAIARQRIEPVCERLARVLRDACTGTVLTGDGFVVS